MQKYHIITLGCQANLADSEKIARILEKFGLTKSENENKGDLLIFNTCSVRQSAEDRVFGLNTKIRKLKSANKRLKVILTGCMVHYTENELRHRLPSFDYFIDIKNIQRELSRIIKITNQTRTKTQTRAKNLIRENSRPNSRKISDSNSALIPISYGCNNFCSYCIVPFSRGREVCRPPEEILKEIKEAVKNDAKEVWLLGQTVNSYKYVTNQSQIKKLINADKELSRKFENKLEFDLRFSDLLRLVNAIPGDFWIRFTSPHPKDFLARHSSEGATAGSDNLIKAMAECKKFAHYINLPVQSGNNEILKKMRRPYTAEHYKKLIGKIRKAIPDIAISTDVIVGFPGETKKQFQDSVKLFKEIKFDMAFISEYSPRSKTLAEKIYKDNVPHAEKERRKRFLNDEVLAKTAFEHNKKLEGKTLKCFADKPGNIRTEGNKLVVLESNRGERSLLKEERSDGEGETLRSDYKIGEFFNVKITKAEPWKLRGAVS